MAKVKKPHRINYIEDIKENELYSTGEMLHLFSNMGLPSSKIWFYQALKTGKISEDLFIRFAGNGWRHIKGDKLRDLINYLIS